MPENTREGVPGLLVAGRYRLAESIGQGGMGRVWRAADEMLDRKVAVKEIRVDVPTVGGTEDVRVRRERTLREARATARIDHPNVVRVYDVVDEGELLWIVMELIPGRSLERVTADDGPLGPRESARVGLGLVAALERVHARGVLHRDIKPGNVLVDGDRVVLTDFGIAALQDATALTMAGMLVGSPDYMAPERIAGRPQGPPSDIWSVGATLCAALAGHSPFARGTTLATLHAVLYEEPQLPDSAGPLAGLLGRLLAKEPGERPELGELGRELRGVAFPGRTPTVRVALPAEGVPPRSVEAPTPAEAPAVAAGPPNSVATTPSSRRTRRTALYAATGAAAVAAVVTAVVLLTPHTTTHHPGTGVGTSPTVEGTTRPRTLPPGAHEEAGGYAWATPAGWRRDVKTGAEVHYTSPDGTQELLAKASLAQGDLLEVWQKSENDAHEGQDYHKILLGRTTFKGRPAVEWEYTFTLKGTPWHARLLGFDENGTSYQVNTWYQPGVEGSALRIYEQVKASFTVL